MTYEIAFYPGRPGSGWDDLIAADQQDGPPLDQAALDDGVATFRRIEAALREQLTEPVEVWVAEELDGDVIGELTAAESGLQVELYDRSASVSFPRRDRDDRSAFHQQVRQAVRVVAAETGYEAYDPQTGRAFDGLIDDQGPGSGATVEPAAATAAPGAGLGVAPGAPGRPDPTSDPRMDPKMLRRRSTLYLVMGLVLAVFGFLRFSSGDTGWLTWVTIGFAFFTLLGASMMRSMAKQVEQRRAEPAGPGTGSETTS